MLVAQKPKGPEWLPVMGASVLFAPIDRSMVLAARRASRAASQTDDGEMPVLQMLDEMGNALSEALIMAGARDWKDVCQQRFDDDGAPVLDDEQKPIFDDLPFSPENLAILLADSPTFDAFDAAYVIPFVTRERERAAPGNGSAASPSGTGEAATRGSGTASSRAQRRRDGAVARALTSNTKPRRSRKKASGAS